MICAADSIIFKPAFDPVTLSGVTFQTIQTKFPCRNILSYAQEAQIAQTLLKLNPFSISLSLSLFQNAICSFCFLYSMAHQPFHFQFFNVHLDCVALEMCTVDSPGQALSNLKEQSYEYICTYTHSYFTSREVKHPRRKS